MGEQQMGDGADERSDEIQAQVGASHKRRPLATYAIAGVIVAVYGLQIYMGGTDTPALIRMGALSPDRVADGEWWRLMSCTFLHGGLLHMALNTYFLLILGRFLERLIGSARFLLLYVASALVGSVGSALFLGETFSVGASGAVWGLLGAHAVLAFRPQGLLPAAQVPGARKAAVFNLAINVLNSFRPYVDMWAHFAGGAAGALLLGSGLLTKSLPTIDSDGQQPLDPELPTSLALKAAAAVGSAVLLVGLVTAVVMGRPWELRRPTPMARTAVEGISIELPDRPHKFVANAGSWERVFGDPLADPVSASVRIGDPMGLMNYDDELEILERSMTTPEHATVEKAASRFREGEHVGVTITYRFPNGARLSRATLYRQQVGVRVDVFSWPAFTTAPSAEKLALSARIPRPTLKTRCDRGNFKFCVVLAKELEEENNPADEAQRIALEHRLYQGGMTPYYLGDTVPKEQARRASLLMRSCAPEDLDACLALGEAYKYGFGVERDDETAASLFDSVCEAGDQRGCAEKAYTLFYGRGAAQDQPRAMALYRQACDGGQARGCNDWAWWQAEKGQDLDLALKLAEKAVSIEPRHTYLDTLAYVHLKRGELDQAEEQIRRALKLDPASEMYKERLEEILAAGR